MRIDNDYDVLKTYAVTTHTQTTQLMQTAESVLIKEVIASQVQLQINIQNAIDDGYHISPGDVQFSYV